MKITHDVLVPTVNETVVSENVAIIAAEKAIESIKNELPEEAHTVEGVEYVISKIRELLNSKKICL